MAENNEEIYYMARGGLPKFKTISKRPQISQKVIDLITELVDKQDEKGMKKYGVSIDGAIDEDYDWNQMALEECVDGMKYLVKENQRLKRQLWELMNSGSD